MGEGKKDGLFAFTCKKHFEDFPIEEEARLLDPWLRENFVMHLFAYEDVTRFEQSVTKLSELVIFHTHYILMILMMPLSLIYVNIGVSITGIILKDKWMTFLPLVSQLIAFYMLVAIMNNIPNILLNLLMSFAFIVSMVIPGHILNYKMHK